MHFSHLERMSINTILSYYYSRLMIWYDIECRNGVDLTLKCSIICFCIPSQIIHLHVCHGFVNEYMYVLLYVSTCQFVYHFFRLWICIFTFKIILSYLLVPCLFPASYLSFVSSVCVSVIDLRIIFCRSQLIYYNEKKKITIILKKKIICKDSKG